MAFTPKLISRQDAAATLGVSVPTVDRLRAEGQLETWPVRGRAMITVASLERFLACETKPEPAVRQRGHDRLRDLLGQSRKACGGVAREQGRHTLAAEPIDDRTESLLICRKKGLNHPPKLGPQ
jgi:Helix-turn-helix domain